MNIILKKYNFKPIFISTNNKKSNLDFLKRNVKLKEINKNFSELEKKDFDILMVNSDQTWSTIVQKEFLFDYGFLHFAENWTIPKFVYGASLGIDYWQFSKDFDEKAKKLLNDFSGISIREIGAIKLVENHFNIKPIFVLDPTFLIDRQYYINIIKNYKKNFNFKNRYICVYELDNNNIINEFIKESTEKLNYQVYNISLDSPKYIEEFIFCINASKAVITDSFHGTVFSIIFNKPFISFINSKRGRDRFFSLNQTFNLKNRVIFPTNNSKPDFKLLSISLSINQTKLNELKNISINYLKKNLGIFSKI